MNPAILTLCLLVAGSYVSGDDVQVLSSASSDFSQRLYEKLAVPETQAIYSPYSIHSALAMTSLGARGETATEMAKTLGLTSLPGKAAHLAYKDLNAKLNSVTDVKLHTANAVFVNPSLSIESQFVSDVKTDYLAQVSNFDLAAAGGPEKAINDFVETKTEGLIKDVLAKGSIDASTAMILVNTIFFNGTWESKFVESKTHKEDFLKLGGAKSQVDMMYDERFVNIKRGVLGADVAELPFNGKRFSLYIALPKTTDGITALEKSLATPGNVDQLFDGLSATRVRLSIPKFKIESKYTLNTALKQLGMTQAFNPLTANFQGISPAGNLFISNVIHKAVIEVKETGTVAAAVTVIEVGITSVEEPPANVFKADHPFVFFLRDNETKDILFQGKFSG